MHIFLNIQMTYKDSNTNDIQDYSETTDVSLVLAVFIFYSLIIMLDTCE